MYKILISGYYGFNNIGDEAILRSVINGLKSRLSDIEITVLSKDPEKTAEKFGVRAADRSSVPALLREIWKCDLLVSGGGSLLQDATSKRSIWYYLMIMKAALFMRKKVFIYSQGMGPISSSLNRKATARILGKVHGIVVRDEKSREFLIELGLPGEKVVVTADPVLRAQKADKADGRKILDSVGVPCDPSRLTVGVAVKERNITSPFTDELERSLRYLVEEKNAIVVLIPFHHSEDLMIAEELERRMNGSVYCLSGSYMTREMLSIVGNLDIMVAARLHALIYAAIMDVPMIGISYDPKINSFMSSIGMKAVSGVYDFTSRFFTEEFERILEKREEICENLESRLESLVAKLDTNEDMIKEIMEKK